jgi:hypothetical protein
VPDDYQKKSENIEKPVCGNAVIRVNDEYEETVWANADTELLVCSTDEMYESYFGITKQTGSIR